MLPQLNIVADAHIWQVDSAFSDLPGFDCRLKVLENSEITPQAVKQADALLVRSGAKVNRGLLEGSSVRFVATATIGDDHIDKAYLAANGIGFASAAGSSTASVLEYMVAALFQLQSRDEMLLSNSSFGVIGAGRIGSRVAAIARLLGMHVVVNDPPRARVEGEEGFVSLDQLLGSSDILTLHTPLHREGEDSTYHLLNAENISRFRGRGIINAARGECIDNQALADWLDGDAQRWVVIDCWENEPQISRRLLAHPQVLIATPHIAGHSQDGKAANTQFVYDALCRFLNVSPVWSMADHLPAVTYDEIEVAESGEALHRLSQIASQLYPITRDSDELKALLDGDDAQLAAGFVRLRRHYHLRRGWANYPPPSLFGNKVPRLVKDVWQTMEPEYE